MKILFALYILLSQTCSAQTFPFGTYYSLPKSNNASSGIIKLRSVMISKDSLVEKYVTKDFAVPEDDEFKSAKKIDTLFRAGQHYHFLYTKNDQFFYISFIVNNANKLLYYRDSYLKTNLFSRADAIKYILADTIPELTTPMYTRQEVQHFSKLPSIDNADTLTLIKALRNISRQEKSEQAMLQSLDVKTRSLYQISRFHSIGYLKHFLEAGISPLVSERDMTKLADRFKNNREIKNLLKEIEHQAL